MTQAVLIEYTVKPGDKVKKGDRLFEIETDKAALDVESPADGFVSTLLADLGQTIFVGSPVIILADEDEPVPQAYIDSLLQELAASAAHTAHQEAAAVAGEARVVRDLSQVKLGDTFLLSEKQKVVAHKMLQSKQEIPCFYLTVRADVTDMVRLRQEMSNAGVKTSYNDFVLLALAAGIEKFPVMAGRLIGDRIELASSIDIALAVAVPDGLVAPVIRQVNKKTVPQIAAETTALAEKARNNKLAPADLEGARMTISNLGVFAVDSFIPIVVPGQCCILGIGRIIDTCLTDDSVHGTSKIVVRKLISMTISVDHRVANGTYAAQFLDFVRKQLEDVSNFTQKPV